MDKLNHLEGNYGLSLMDFMQDRFETNTRIANLFSKFENENFNQEQLSAVAEYFRHQKKIDQMVVEVWSNNYKPEVRAIALNELLVRRAGSDYSITMSPLDKHFCFHGKRGSKIDFVLYREMRSSGAPIWLHLNSVGKEYKFRVELDTFIKSFDEKVKSIVTLLVWLDTTLNKCLALYGKRDGDSPFVVVNKGKESKPDYKIGFRTGAGGNKVHLFKFPKITPENEIFAVRDYLDAEYKNYVNGVILDSEQQDYHPSDFV